jgi:hypothetical protein
MHKMVLIQDQILLAVVGQKDMDPLHIYNPKGMD